MATEIPIKIQIVKSLSTANPSRIVAVKADGDTAFSLWVTDKTGIPYPLKDLQNNVIITNTDGNLQITSSSTNTNINLASSILATINSALQSGDNISELVNDSGYLTTFTETDPIFQASEASLFVSGDKANLDNQSGVNSGNQTSIVGISGTKAQFNTELTDGDFLFVGDVLDTPDATVTTKGILKLTGDLGGTADNPTTPTAIHKIGDEVKQGILTLSDGLKIVGNTTSTTATKVNVQENDGTINTISKSDLVNVVEVNDVPTLPLVGEVGKIYVVKNVNKIYRWNGTFYQELAGSDISGLQAQIDLKANDSDVVKLTGNQTISGQKSFSLTGKIGMQTNNGFPAISVTALGSNVNSAAEFINNSSSPYSSALRLQTNPSGGVGNITLRVSNASSDGVSISSQSGNGDSYISNIAYGGTGRNYVGRNNGTETYSVDKIGNVIGNSYIKRSTPANNILLAGGGDLAQASLPVSTATQTALNLKANLASPTFTGIPLVPTAPAGTNTTQIATTAFVKLAAKRKQYITFPISQALTASTLWYAFNGGDTTNIYTTQLATTTATPTDEFASYNKQNLSLLNYSNCKVTNAFVHWESNTVPAPAIDIAIQVKRVNGTPFNKIVARQTFTATSGYVGTAFNSANLDLTTDILPLDQIRLFINNGNLGNSFWMGEVTLELTEN